MAGLARHLGAFYFKTPGSEISYCMMLYDVVYFSMFVLVQETEMVTQGVDTCITAVKQFFICNVTFIVLIKERK